MDINYYSGSARESVRVGSRAAAICMYDISRYFVYTCIAIFFWSYRDANVHGYTEIDGRIERERRKYTKSHSADATSVGPHTYIRIPLRCCVHIHVYCKLSEIKLSLFKRVTANAYNKYLFFTILYVHVYYFLKYCHGRVHGYGDNIVKHAVFFMRKMHGATCIVAKLQHATIKSFWNHYVIGKHIIDVQSRMQ